MKESLGIGPRCKVQVDPMNCSGEGGREGLAVQTSMGYISSSGSGDTVSWMWFALMPGLMGSGFSHRSAREAGLGTFTSDL